MDFNPIKMVHLQLYHSETKQLGTPYYLKVAFCEDVFRDIWELFLPLFGVHKILYNDTHGTFSHAGCEPRRPDLG